MPLVQRVLHPAGPSFLSYIFFFLSQLNGTTEEVLHDIGRKPVKGLFPHTSTFAVLQADQFLCAETTHKDDECARSALFPSYPKLDSTTTPLCTDIT